MKMLKNPNEIKLQQFYSNVDLTPLHGLLSALSPCLFMYICTYAYMHVYIYIYTHIDACAKHWCTENISEIQSGSNCRSPLRRWPESAGSQAGWHQAGTIHSPAAPIDLGKAKILKTLHQLSCSKLSNPSMSHNYPILTFHHQNPFAMPLRNLHWNQLVPTVEDLPEVLSQQRPTK